MEKKLINRIEEVAFHRNGIAGEGFYAVRFTADIEPVSRQESNIWGMPESSGQRDARFLAILFDGPGQCAVVCLDLMESCGVKFAGGNSWRGDQYEPELRKAIETQQTSGGVRVGPFCVPTE